MSEEQVEEKMETEENKFLIMMGVFLGIIWVIFIVIDLTSDGLAGFIYFLYGLFNIGAFLVYFRSKEKKKQSKWIKTSLFNDKDEKKEE